METCSAGLQGGVWFRQWGTSAILWVWECRSKTASLVMSTQLRHMEMRNSGELFFWNVCCGHPDLAYGIVHHFTWCTLVCNLLFTWQNVPVKTSVQFRKHVGTHLKMRTLIIIFLVLWSFLICNCQARMRYTYAEQILNNQVVKLPW